MSSKVPFIEQMSQTECGIACIAMVSGFYGKHVQVHEIRNLIGVGRDGSTLYDLLTTSKELGFTAKFFEGEASQLYQIKLPAILFWNHNHYVVLEKLMEKKAIILDPSEGRKTITFQELDKCFSNYVLQLKPNETFKKQKENSLWKPYLNILSDKRFMLLSLLFFSIILQLFVLVIPILTQKFIDNILLADVVDPDLSSILIIGIIFSFISYILFFIVRNEISIKLYKYIDYKVSWNFVAHLLKLPYIFFQLRQTGDLLYRFANLRSIRQILSNQMMRSLLDILLLAVVIIYMFYKSPFLTIILLLFVCFSYGFILFLRKFLYEANRKEFTKDTNLYGFQTEVVMGMSDIKSSGSEDKISNKWNRLYLEFADAFIKKERLYGFLGAFTTSITFFMPLFVILVGSGQVFDGEITVGELIALQTVSSFFITASNSLILTLESFYQVKVLLRRVSDVTDTPPETNEKEIKEKKKIEGDVSLSNVNFSYTKNAENTLENVNLHIKKGQKIAIVGLSGSGKSTLAKIIIGLHKPTKGRIMYDGIDFNRLDKPYTRKQMGIVTQDPFLFNQTILQNIRLSNDELPLEQIIEAAKIAQIHQTISEMPMGYETIVSEGGENISGGQKQRIAIARALAHKPKIIVFDEATNSLDNINEYEIDNYLSNIQTTRIIIAHRLSTIKDADQIIVIDNGNILCKGTHKELLEESTYYNKLYSTDFEEVENYNKIF
ncbi:peptidase domain-containing ABC transporter [Virgibacillus sp. NKC19-3]|uniref:peptidase domain-containing ABC transporter n=1 Tax=Virgibacillus saliphilus TaxID=2831674 RepID=UPI001C9A9A59|nr:peptidase domain-containing ABC transporter [Virgibacillus sp. NKC19-3]MBY7144314.1 peptidase domain-containing ABC transporter [Virgibacillus sp. NKC19-3]